MERYGGRSFDKRLEKKQIDHQIKPAPWRQALDPAPVHPLQVKPGQARL